MSNKRHQHSQAGNSLRKQTFVCMDCETTGLDPKTDSIIEIAAIKFNFDEVLDSFESLIDPARMIPEESIAIHHITDEMVAGAPKIEEMIPKITEFLGDHIIVGHGVKFDIDLVVYAMKRKGLDASKLENARYLDTLRLARLYGDSPTNSLEKLAEHFNVERSGKHRAMQDVKMNIEVFKHLARQYHSTKDMFKALDRPIDLKKMPLGKHKGRPLRQIPDQYLRWAANKDFDQDLLFSIRKELKRRKGGDLFSQAGNPFSDL